MRNLQMQTPFRAIFLLVVASVVFHLSTRSMLAVIFGYLLCELLDGLLARRARKTAIEEVVGDELFDWEVSTDDPEWEVKGGVERVRLTGANQVIVTRIADLIRRTKTV